MQTLEIKVSVDLSNPEQAQAAINFIFALHGGNIITPSQEDTAEVETKPEKKRKLLKKKTEEPLKKEVAKVEKETEEEGYTVADVRTKLSEKVNTHREAIKAKLTELGAKNVSTLEEEQYPTFMEFLEGLK